RGTLLWPIAGVFLVTALVGTLLQWLLVTMVLRPLEARDERARAELAASAVATAVAEAPALPSDAALESLLVRQRQQMGGHPAWIGFRRAGGAAITVPRERAFMFAPPQRPGEPPAPDSGAIAGRGERHHGRIEVLARRTVFRNGV